MLFCIQKANKSRLVLVQQIICVKKVIVVSIQIPNIKNHVCF